MPPQNNTITNEQFLEVLKNTRKELKQDIKDIRHDMKIYLVGGLGVFVALLIGMGVIVWEVAKDVNAVQIEVKVQAELAELRAQVQTLNSR